MGSQSALCNVRRSFFRSWLRPLNQLEIAYSVELYPNIVGLDVHGTNGMEDGNGVEDYGMQESGIWDNHLKDNGM
jgi:hypothetical protein